MSSVPLANNGQAVSSLTQQAAASMGETLTAVEHRCLQLVMMAEAKAKEDRAALEQRIAELENGQVAHLDHVEEAVTQCERSLNETNALLGSVGAEFGSAHEASSRTIKQLLTTRAASETSAFQRIKLAIAEFHDYRREMKRNALWRIAQSHQIEVGGSAPNNNSDPSTPNAKGRKTSPRSRADVLEQQYGDQFPLSHFKQHQLLSELREKFVGTATAHENEEVPFVLDAVYAYLVGAIEALLKYSDTIAAQLQRSHIKEAQQRRNLLLDEEREVFRRRVRADHPPSALSEINNEAMSRVLLERLVDQSGDRADSVHAIMQRAAEEVTSTLRSRLDRSTEAFVMSMHNVASSSSQSATATAALVHHQAGGGSAAKSDGNTSGGSTNLALARFQQMSHELGERLFVSMIERHSEDYAKARGEFETKVEELKRSFTHRDVVVNQEVTVFSLEQLQAEKEHRLLVNRVMHDRYGTVEQRYRAQVASLSDKVGQLQVALDEARAERAASVKIAEEKDVQIAQLEETLQVRKKSAVSLKSEVRQVTYEVNYASFGETWQESLLNMRSRIHKELRDENMRFVAKVSNIIRTHMGDESQTEQLYETRLQSVVEEMDADANRKMAELRRRFSAERQLLHDESEMRIRSIREDCDREKAAYKTTLDAEYEKKVTELNELFDARVRSWEGRVADTETFFANKMTECKKQLQRRENELEIASAKRDVEVVRQYEAEAAALKLTLNQREHQIEAERMKIMASVENKIHEKVMLVRRSFDSLVKQLQDTVFMFAERQREAFDEQRAKEHMIFSHFMFGSIRTHQEHGQLEIEAANRRVETEATDALVRQDEALLTLRTQHEELVKHNEETHTERIVHLRKEQEMMLRATQNLRCEQDTQFWGECSSRLREASSTLVESKAAAERIMQQRYVDIIQRVNQYLQNDVMAAHQTFERECRSRQKQLQSWVNSYHRISLHTDAMLWLEVCGRGAIEKEYYSMLSSIRIMEGEEKRTRLYCRALDDAPYQDIEQITFDDISDVRREYEALLEQHRDFSANISHDYLTALGASLREQQQTSQIMSGIFTTRLDALTQGLKDRFAVYSECRDNAINKELQRIVDAVQQAAVEFFRESEVDREQAQAHRSMMQRNAGVFSDADDAASPGRSRGRSRGKASPQRRAKSAGATRGLTPITDAGGNRRDGGRSAPKGGASSPNAGAENLSPAGRVLDPMGKAGYDNADYRLVEYFTHLRSILTKAFDDLDRRVHFNNAQNEERRNAAVRRIHDEYLDASGALMHRLEEKQSLIDERDCAVVQLAARLEAKSASEVRAAVLSDDLGALARKYDMLSRGWMMHAAMSTAGGGGHTPRGRAAAGSSSANDRLIHDHGTGGGTNTLPTGDEPGRVMLAFMSGLGGKRPTRDAVLENIAMRERLLATEWFGEDLLRSAMTSDAVGSQNPIDTPPRPRRERRSRTRAAPTPAENQAPHRPASASYVEEVPDEDGYPQHQQQQQHHHRSDYPQARHEGSRPGTPKSVVQATSWR